MQLGNQAGREVAHVGGHPALGSSGEVAQGAKWKAGDLGDVPLGETGEEHLGCQT